MSNRSACWWCLTLPVLAAVMPLVVAAQPPPRAEEVKARPAELDTAVLAHRLWAVTDAILQHHIDPPARQEMLLSATRRLMTEVASTVPPAELSRRISGVTTEKQYADLLRELWPADAPARTAEELQTRMMLGLLARVPGKPALLPPDVVKETRAQDQIATNQYVGLGIQIRLNEEAKCPQLVTPLGKGPARRGGLRPGDLIVEVNGQSTHGLPLPKVIEMLRGEENTKVTLGIRQPGEKETRTIRLTREVVPFPNLLAYRRGPEDTWIYRIDPNAPIAYVQIKTLSSSTLHELRQLERQLMAEGIQALIVDLRFNPGGVLQHAALVADGFLDGGVMWRFRDAGNRVKEVRADPDCLFRDWPLVVLVNRQTVSAAALIAAALQDNGRAIVVGEDSGEFGWVRRRIELPEALGALLVPTGRLERAQAPRPDRKNPRDEAEERTASVVHPDHVVPMTPKQGDDLLIWYHNKELSELPKGVTDQQPDDPPFTKAVELLQARLKQAKPTEKPQP